MVITLKQKRVTLPVGVTGVVTGVGLVGGNFTAKVNQNNENYTNNQNNTRIRDSKERKKRKTSSKV